MFKTTHLLVLILFNSQPYYKFSITQSEKFRGHHNFGENLNMVIKASCATFWGNLSHKGQAHLRLMVFVFRSLAGQLKTFYALLIS